MKQTAQHTRANASAKPATPVQRPPLLLMPFLVIKRLLSSQVKLRRRDGGLRVVLRAEGEATIPPPADQDLVSTAPAGLAVDAAKPAHDIHRMHDELDQLLARHHHTRHFMRYLAYTERTLKLGGPEALAHMPVEVMRKTLEQLQELVTDWSSAGLAELRMQLEVLIAEKEEVSNQTFGSTDTPSDFDTPRKLHVEEATVSQFQAAERGWQSPNRPPS